MTDINAESTPTPDSWNRPSGIGAKRWSLLYACLLAGITLIAFALRLFLLTHSGSLWRDEALFLFVSRLPTIGDTIHFLRFHESHPPLFYLLMRGWQALFGTSDLVVGLLPVLIGTALPLAGYRIGTGLFSRRTGLIFALLVCVSPGFTQYSAQIRPYSLLPLLYLISTYCLWRGLQSGARRAWIGYLLATLAMLYTHNWGWLALAGQWVAVAVSLPLKIGRPVRRRIAEWLMAQAVILLGYAPWLSSLLFQFRHAGHPPSSYGFHLLLTLTLRSLWEAIAGFAPLKLLPVVCLLFLPLWTRRSDPVTVLKLILFAGSALTAICLCVPLSIRSDVSQLRCLLTVVPGLVIVIAYALDLLLLSKSPLYILLFCLETGFLFLYCLNTTLNPSLFGRSNSHAVAVAVAAHALPNDLIIISPEFMSPSFNYYFRRNNEQIDFPSGGRIETEQYNDLYAHSIDPESFRRAEERIEAAHAAGRRIWFITGEGYLHLGTELTLPADRNWYRSLQVRTGQLLNYLTHLCGEPDTTLVPAGHQEYAENLRALLFAPSRISRKTEPHQIAPTDPVGLEHRRLSRRNSNPTVEPSGRPQP